MPPETSFAPKEGDSQPPPEQASTEAAVDELNGEAATQIAKQIEDPGVEKTPASLQATTVDSAVTEESVPPSEAPVSASKETHTHEAVTEEVVESQELVTAADEPASQVLEKIAVETVPRSEEEPGVVVEEILDKQKPVPTSAELNADNVDEKETSVPEHGVEGLKNTCLDVAPKNAETALGEVNVDVATQNENLVEKEPTIVLSKTIQSKVTSNCAGPSLSTRHVSGGLPCVKSWSLPHISLSRTFYF